MENYLIQIPADRKSFFLSLMKELSFVSFTNEISIIDKDVYINSILESEKDIEQGRLISHSELKKNIQTWR